MIDYIRTSAGFCVRINRIDYLVVASEPAARQLVERLKLQQ